MMATISASRILETLVFPGILGYFGSVVNALSDTPSEEDYIRRALHQATVLGNYVYIDGGEISQFENNQRGRISDPVNSTLSIDISLSWSTDNVEIRRIEKPREIPGKSRGYLWTDFRRQEFYIWGGFWPYEYKKADFDWVPIAKFKADGRGGGDWSLVEMADERMFRILRPTEMGAFTQVNSTAFLIGGQVSDATDQRLQRNTPAQALPGMMTFDFESRAVQNSTALNFSPFGSETRLGASAIHVPSFGPNGLVFVMGGHQPPLDSAYSIADTRPVSFSSLTFFDPVTRQSFTQTTTGDIPRSPRRAFCTVGFATEGGYDIFLFGGDNAVSRTRYDDAYILSLPGFHWTKLPSSTAGLRAYHACVPVGKRQVLNVGGNFQEGNWGEPDPANRGLLLFDMTTLQWKNDYDAKAGPYERADRIKTWYQNGSLANVQWSSEEVQKMFATQNLLSPGPDNAVSTGPAGSTPVGAIAGGVVGGIAGVAVIVLVIWLLVRRRKKQHQQSLPGSQQYYQHELRPLKELKEGRNIHMMPNSRGPLEMSTERSAGELPGYSVKPPEPNYQQHYVAPVELDSGYAGPDRV